MQIFDVPYQNYLDIVSAIAYAYLDWPILPPAALEA